MSEVELLSIISRSVAWVARDMVGSLMSNTLPAELKIRLPDVVVIMLRSAEVELIERVPAPAISMELPVPAFSTCKTLPVEEA